MRIDQSIIIGAGGTGQQLIPSLIRLLTYHPHGSDSVVVYDGDEFEEHNKQRQIGYTGTKASVMDQLLIAQGLPAVCVPHFMSADRLKALLRRGSGTVMVLATVDNDATRKMCCDVLEASDRDFLFVTPGNSDAQDADKAIKGNVLWFGRVDGQRIGINPALLFPNIESPQDAIPRHGSCIEHAPSAPQLISANALAAAYTLAIVQNLLDDCLPFEASHMFFNGRSFTLTAN